MSSVTVFLKLDIDISPQDCYYRLKDFNPLVFLDSSLDSSYSNYSYLGFNPSVILESFGYKNKTSICGKLSYYSYQHPLSFMQEGIQAWGERDTSFYAADKQKIEPAEKEGLPDFCGGFMGYLAYDLKNYIEKLPQTAGDDYGMPLIYLVFFRQAIAYSHSLGQWYYIRNFSGREMPESIKGMHEQAKKESADVENCCRSGDNKRADIIAKYKRRGLEAAEIKSNFKKSQYMDSVGRAKQYIYDGDIYQVNLSQRFTVNLKVEPEDFYYILRTKNPAPYSAFIKTPDFCVASTSPERFLYIKGSYVETRPIKGTRPRGKTAEEDLAYERELAESKKDRAELNMIVDLERNDLGKFCYYGSVEVAEHAVIEKYARVLHSVSTVTGKIKDSAKFSDIIKATFPGGSITGAPKIRAMEIIDELEPTARSVYTGSVGYIGIDGTADLNIAIRTMIIKGGRYCYNVGGGIVADSSPEDEYEETLAKGLALRETLNLFGAKNLEKQAT
ncbi:MAG: aminodeoxychorismate synthase component I [Actinomycetota bacterium]